MNKVACTIPTEPGNTVPGDIYLLAGSGDAAVVTRATIVASGLPSGRETIYHAVSLRDGSIVGTRTSAPALHNALRSRGWRLAPPGTVITLTVPEPSADATAPDPE